MKKFFAIALCFAIVYTFSSCSDDNNPTGPNFSGSGTFTVNGAGLSNTVFNSPPEIPGFPFPVFGYGVYETIDSVSIIVNFGISQTADSMTGVVILYFKGNRTGTYQSASTPSVIQLTLSTGKETLVFIGGFESAGDPSPIPNTNLSLTISRYEAVNGKIQGSYSGTLRNFDGKGFGSTTVTINGQFNVTRLPDDFDDFDLSQTLGKYHSKEVLVD